MTETIGILHPGEMGITLAGSALNSAWVVWWASQGRSPQTIERARSLNLQDAHSLTQLCRTCTLLISICPPHAADDVVRQVLESGFKGLYVDANAISPQRATAMAELVAEHGLSFVDGSVIGGPGWGHDVYLYLSGQEAQRVADCFAAGPLRIEIIGEQPGKASALKMAYAAYTKGRRAMLLSIIATAEALGVRSDLEKQWARDGSDLFAQTTNNLGRVASKAWRFEGEMHEIAATFAAAGLPDGFHLAAAEVYARLADFKVQESPVELAQVLKALLETDQPGNVG